MDRHVLVSLLEPVVLLDVVEIVASHHNGPVHLHLGDDSGQDTTADGNLNNISVKFLIHEELDLFTLPVKGHFLST